eukprot:6327848-Alexandrium_andersonii.AAC.1
MHSRAQAPLRHFEHYHTGLEAPSTVEASLAQLLPAEGPSVLRLRGFLRLLRFGCHLPVQALHH